MNAPNLIRAPLPPLFLRDHLGHPPEDPRWSPLLSASERLSLSSAAGAFAPSVAPARSVALAWAQGERWPAFERVELRISLLACAALVMEAEELIAILKSIKARASQTGHAMERLHAMPDELLRADPGAFLRASANLSSALVSGALEREEQAIGGLGPTLNTLGLSMDGDLGARARDSRARPWRMIGTRHMWRDSAASMPQGAALAEQQFWNALAGWSENLTPYGPRLPDSRREAPIAERRELGARLGAAFCDSLPEGEARETARNMLWKGAATRAPALMPQLIAAGLAPPLDAQARQGLVSAAAPDAQGSGSDWQGFLISAFEREDLETTPRTDANLPPNLLRI